MKRNTKPEESTTTYLGLPKRKFVITLVSLIVGTFALAYLIVIPGGQWSADTDADRQNVQQMVLKGYNVDSVGSAINRKMNGYGITAAKGATIHTCTGFSKDDVIAKKPIECDDFYVLQPKK